MTGIDLKMKTHSKDQFSDPQFASLDRIDNSIGHNKENVVIACLQCNVGRKTMHQGRYAFTKQLVITKL